MNITEIVSNTILESFKSKICPICNNKLIYNKIFSYTNMLLTDTQYKCLSDDLLCSYIQCQGLTMYNMSFPNGLSLIPLHKNIYVPFAQINDTPLDLTDLEADNFLDLYTKLNKIITFQ